MGQRGTMCATKRRQPLVPNKVVRAMAVVTKLAISALRICEPIQWKGMMINTDTYYQYHKVVIYIYIYFYMYIDVDGCVHILKKVVKRCMYIVFWLPFSIQSACTALLEERSFFSNYGYKSG